MKNSLNHKGTLDVYCITTSFIFVKSGQLLMADQTARMWNSMDHKYYLDLLMLDFTDSQLSVKLKAADD
jgi:hypothetical protein